MFFFFHCPGYSVAAQTRKSVHEKNTCSNVPNRRVGRNKRAGGKILRKH